MGPVCASTELDPRGGKYKDVSPPQWFVDMVGGAMLKDGPTWNLQNHRWRIALAWHKVQSGEKVCRHCRRPLEGVDIVVIGVREGVKLAHAKCVKRHAKRRGGRREPKMIAVPLEPFPTDDEIVAKRARQQAEHEAWVAEIDRRAEEERRAEEVAQKEYKRLRQADTCDILAAHHDDLADDPDRLSTDFIKKLIGRKDPCPDESA
jgi:hypothetical protein